MDFIKEKVVYVYFNPHIVSSYVERLTILRKDSDLLFFKEKDPYYAVECKTFLFYGYSYNLAGNALIVEKRWHLFFAKLFEKGRMMLHFFNKKIGKKEYNNVLKKDSSLSI